MTTYSKKLDHFTKNNMAIFKWFTFLEYLSLKLVNVDVRHLGHVAAVRDALQRPILQVPPSTGVLCVATATLHLARQLGRSGNVRDEDFVGNASDHPRLQGLALLKFSRIIKMFGEIW